MFNFFTKPKPNHSLDYLILFSILTVTAIIIKFFSLTDLTLMLATFTLSIGYIFWGIFHHTRAGLIHTKIVLEYVGLAILVNIIVLTLII